MDGFRYECKLNNKIFSATFNVSDDTVTCIIRDNVSLFMYRFHHHNVTAAAIMCIQSVVSSSGEQTVPLDLIWTNDTVTYSLNGSPTDDIMC